MRIRIGLVDGVQICARIELLHRGGLGGVLHLLVVDRDALLADVVDLDVVVVSVLLLGDTAEHLIQLKFVLAEILVQLNIIHIQILNIMLLTQHRFLDLRGAFLLEQSKRRIGLGGLPKHALSLAQQAVLVELAQLVRELTRRENIIPAPLLLQSQEFANLLLTVFINLQ